jgi:hypothetical protein
MFFVGGSAIAQTPMFRYSTHATLSVTPSTGQGGGQGTQGGDGGGSQGGSQGGTQDGTTTGSLTWSGNTSLHYTKADVVDSLAPGNIVGLSQDAVLVNNSSAPVGPFSGDYSITGDGGMMWVGTSGIFGGGCAGATLQPGESCTVNLTWGSQNPVSASGTLTLVGADAPLNWSVQVDAFSLVVAWPQVTTSYDWGSGVTSVTNMTSFANYGNVGSTIPTYTVSGNPIVFSLDPAFTTCQPGASLSAHYTSASNCTIQMNVVQGSSDLTDNKLSIPGFIDYFEKVNNVDSTYSFTPGGSSIVLYQDPTLIP